MAEKKWLVISPEGLTFMQDGATVLLALDYPNDDLGLAPNIQLAMRMTPDEARQFAKALAAAADRVETSPVQ